MLPQNAPHPISSRASLSRASLDGERAPGAMPKRPRLPSAALRGPSVTLARFEYCAPELDDNEVFFFVSRAIDSPWPPSHI